MTKKYEDVSEFVEAMCVLTEAVKEETAHRMLVRWLTEYATENAWSVEEPLDIIARIVRLIVRIDEPGVVEELRGFVAGNEELAKVFERKRTIADEALVCLETHGVTITKGWSVNGSPSAEVETFLDSLIEDRFPTDETKLAEEVISFLVACTE